MRGARALNLADCGLTEVPPEVFDLAETLEVLDLGGNALRGLPDDVASLARLRVLFCSGNRMPRLPAVLGACPSLTQIGCRAAGVVEVPARSLPPTLRWLTLTDNRIADLPEALGACPDLRKVMLAGNRLRRLPESLAGAANLELLRVSANAFETLPPWLPRLPRLAWLAWADNPAEAPSRMAPPRGVPWSDLRVGALLGEGASGRVVAALWRRDGREPARPVALKLFKSAMTSDGRPSCEMAACLAAGEHVALASGLGRVVDHPEGADGLLMPLVPEAFRVLADPPSLASCSRDVYAAGLSLPLVAVIRLVGRTAAGLAHLHARSVSHGDVYAHNILWDGERGDAVLGDFGAASFLPSDQAGALERLDVLAWGTLLDELLERCREPAPEGLIALRDACVGPVGSARPDMREVAAVMAGLARDER